MDEGARIADALERIADVAEDALSLALFRAVKSVLGRSQYEDSVKSLMERASSRRRRQR